MSYFPKEGLITLHQAQNPPISQAITEELNKAGYGEFVTETELNEVIANIEGTLTTEQKNKVQELTNYTIGASTGSGTIWPNIPAIKTDGVMEIGRILDFHHVSANAGDFRARLSCEAVNRLELSGGTFRTNYFLADLSIEINKITPRTTNGNLIINTFEPTQKTIVEFKNDLTTQFFGEISTPTFNSLDVNSTISTLQACGPNKNTGCVTLPTWTDNLDGTITINNDGVFMYADNSTGDGCFIRLPALTPATLTPTDGYTNYAYSFYNDGNPIYGLTLNPFTFLADARFVPAARIIRDGVSLYIVHYSNYGVSMAAKTLIKDIFVNGVERLTGLELSTTANRIPSLTAGVCYFGVNLVNLSVVENINLIEYYLVNSVWNNQQVTEYDILYYSTATNRTALPDSRWVAKYFFRSISDKNVWYYIHGGNQSSRNNAINEEIPANQPFLISSSTIYVGKCTIRQGANNAQAHPRQWTDTTVSTGITDHNSLNDIQGGIDDEYNHLTNSEHLKVQELSNYTIGASSHAGTTWPNIPVIKTDGVMEIGQYLDFHNVTDNALDYKARLYCSDTNTLNIENMNMTKLNGNNLNNTTWSFIPKVDTNGDMIIGDKIQFTDTSGGTTGMSITHTMNNLTVDGGTLNAQYIKCQSQASIGDIKPFYAEDPVIIRRNGFGETKIVEFKKNRTTQFFGEITTPTFGSSDAVTKINTFNTNLNAVLEPHGFYQPTISAFIIDISLNRFRLADTQGTYGVYYKGYKCDVGTFYNVTLPPLGVTRYIWFTATNLIPSVHSGDDTGFNFMEHVPIAYVINFGNDETGNFYVIGDERHGIVMDRATQEYLHKTQGSKYVSGGLLSGYILNDDIETLYTVGQTTFYDADLRHILPESNNFNLIYRDDLTGAFNIYDTTQTSQIVIIGIDIAYNQFNGTNWVLTQIVDDNRWVNYYVLASNTYRGTTGKYFIITGQEVYTTEAAALAETLYDLNLENFPIAACVPLAKVTYRRIYR